jgi:membrane protease subunit HflK
MFGHTTMIETAGIHFKVPFFSQKHVLDGTTQSMAIGYSIDTDESEYNDSLMITSDFNFVNVDFYMEYRISDPIQYVYGSDSPEEILRNVATASIRNTVGQYSVDDVMTTGKAQIEIDIREDIIEELESHQTGLTLLNITIQDAEPPTTEVTAAFKDVENKKQEAESALNDANKYKNTQTAAAEAEAEQIKQEANAAKTERINQATEEVAKFEALYEEYSNNPNTVRTRLYLEAIEDILPNMKIISGDDVKVVTVDGSNVVEQ